jgi:hypothetical protein
MANCWRAECPAECRVVFVLSLHPALPPQPGQMPLLVLMPYLLCLCVQAGRGVHADEGWQCWVLAGRSWLLEGINKLSSPRPALLRQPCASIICSSHHLSVVGQVAGNGLLWWQSRCWLQRHVGHLVLQHAVLHLRCALSQCCCTCGVLKQVTVLRCAGLNPQGAGRHCCAAPNTVLWRAPRV